MIAAAARALAGGDALTALQRVALRDDPPALALRGIAMAQLGEHPRARELLRRAASAFGAHEPVARARCVVAEAEVALAQRDLGGDGGKGPAPLLAAAHTLQAHGDTTNALQARLVAARRLVLLGRLAEASALLAAHPNDSTPTHLPAPLAAVAALTRAELALRALHIQLLDFLREFMQGSQPPGNGQTQGQKNHGQKPHPGLYHLSGNVMGQLVTLLQTQQHHDLVPMRHIPFGEAAPRLCIRPQVQIGVAFGHMERRQWGIAHAQNHPLLCIPLHHAQSVLVVMAFGPRQCNTSAFRNGLCPGMYAQIQQQGCGTCKLPIRQLIGLMHPGAISQPDKAAPDQYQSPQAPEQQTACERLTARRHLGNHHASSRGMK